jgi:hypothetical protein
LEYKPHGNALSSGKQSSARNISSVLADDSTTDFLAKLKGLEEFDMQALQRALVRFDRELEQRKSKLKISSNTIVPMISMKEKIIVLPNTMAKEDYGMGTIMLYLANKLELKIKSVEYKGKEINTQLTRDQEDFVTGLIVAMGDDNNFINFSNSEDMVELGRKYFRATQLKKLIEKDEQLGPNALKKSNRFLGNCKGQTISLKMSKGTKNVSVDYLGTMIPGLFHEADHIVELTNILRILIRESSERLSKSVVAKDLPKLLKSYQEVVEDNCTRYVKVKGLGKKSGERTIATIPHKMSESSLLTKEENKLIREFGSSLYKNPSYAKDHDSWVRHLTQYPGGFTQTVKDIEAVYRNRSEVLTSFASLTSKRLREIRTANPTLANIRKKDVKSSDLTPVLLGRKSPLMTLVREIRDLDQHKTRSFITGNGEITNLIAERVERWLPLSGIYKDLEMPEIKSGLSSDVKTESLPISDRFASLADYSEDYPLEMGSASLGVASLGTYPNKERLRLGESNQLKTGKKADLNDYINSSLRTSSVSKNRSNKGTQ